MSKKCPDYIQDLNDYLDGDVDPDLCAEIEKHIGDCHNCKLMVDSLKKTVRLCRENGECEELPAEISAKLTAKLKARWEAKFGQK